MAASLAVVAGAVLFGIFGRPIDTVRRDSLERLASDVVAAVAEEHHRCAAQLANCDRTEWDTPREAGISLSHHLETPVPVADLSGAGFTFRGGGFGNMPHHATTGQLVYGRGKLGEDGCPDALLSVFVLPDQGQFDHLGVGDRAWKWVVVGEPPACSKRVLCATADGLAYLVVCCDESELDALGNYLRSVARRRR